MSARTFLASSLLAAAFLAGCGGDSDSIASSDSVPVTLGELDDVVVTVAPEDLRGEPIRLEDTDDDGVVEIVEPEVIGDDNDSAITQIDATNDDDAAADAPTEAADADDGLNPLGGDDPEDKKMPDVICMGLQEAQDEIQDHGVFFSKSVDATGDGRRQLWDRNWIVVGQDPEPGESIGENEAVLSVVKKSEDNPC